MRKGPSTEAQERKPWASDEIEGRVDRDLTQKRGEEVRIEHVKSHTGVRGNEAADKLAALGAQIQDGHRIVERNSREPQMLDAEYKDNG